MRQIQEIPAGAGTQSNAVIPPDIRKRYGITEDLHAEYYDTLLFGTGQTLRDEERAFAGSATRDDQITNIVGQGFLLNERQFLACGVWVHTYFNQRDPIPQDAPDVMRLYELYNAYTYWTFAMGSNEKQTIWSHRIPSGGGLYGSSNIDGRVVYNNGYPHQKNVFWFKEPYFIGLRQTFEFKLKWMNRLATAGVYPGTINPLTDFNSNITAEKLLRIGIVGIEGRGWTNG